MSQLSFSSSMAGFVEAGEVGFEEGLPWLPSRVLDEAFSDSHHLQRQVKHKQHQQRHFRRSKLPADPLPAQSNPTSSRQHHKPKYSCNRASRGPGMQAIFLESGEKSCGTGVFLPQRGGTNCQPSRKPACSPVLLPSRVVQALNLNVHAIGLQISPRKDSKANDLNSVKNKTGKDVSTKCSQHHISSPEIFLPEEWSY